MAAGFFEIRDDSDFFGIMVRTRDALKATHAKRVEDLLLLLVGLAHLREWIAPGYKRGAKAINAAEQFVSVLFEDPNYQIVLQLANHAKHQRRTSLPKTQMTTFVETFDERDTPIDSWLDFDRGPASAYEYGDQDLLRVFDAVIQIYQDKWFGLPIEQRITP